MAKRAIPLLPAMAGSASRLRLRPGRKNLTNVVRITDPAWRSLDTGKAIKIRRCLYRSDDAALNNAKARRAMRRLDGPSQD
jgi:hypothetical protein